MATGFEDLRRTIESVVQLTSSGNSTANEFPLQINAWQCELLARKASEILPLLDEFEYALREQDTPDWIPAASELHRVLKDAEVLVRGCCCICSQDLGVFGRLTRMFSKKRKDCCWLKLEIMRGDLKETFAKILYDLAWHLWVLYSLLVEKSNNVSKNWLICDGKLGLNDDIVLSAAAKWDRESLRELITSSHVCKWDDVCKQNLGGKCLAVQLLENLDAEKKESVHELVPRILRVKPQHLSKGETLGRGGFAEVTETEWLGQKFAQKIFFDSEVGDESFKKEIAAMVSLSHPNIVRVVCCAENNSKWVIVMELMYRSLFDLLKDRKKSKLSFSNLQAVDLMQQIAEGVRYVHSRKLVHRDLKSLNVLIGLADPQPPSTGTMNIITTKTNLVAKIADFGQAKVKNASTMLGRQTKNTGTTKWMAPEVPNTWDHEAEASSRFHPMKLDVYSFGIMCYEILSGDEPYEGVPLGQLLARVKAGQRPTLPRKIPGRLAALIQQCWSGNPLQRPDFSTICTELRFIKSLLLQGHNFANDIGLDFEFNLQQKLASVKVQGPWGGTGNEWSHQFCDGMATSIKRIMLKYDGGAPTIWYMETEYDISGTSFVSGHGNKDYGTARAMINIDGPTEYVAQIEGSFGISEKIPGLMVVQSLTIHTNIKTHGPFGGDMGTGVGETKFKSDFGRILGFYGRSHKWLDQIGCFIAPVTMTIPS